jgi:hypothetical protein
MTKAERVEAVKAAFIVGVRKHLPAAEHVEMTDDAILDLQKLGLLDVPDPEFEEFLEGLRNPEPPREVPDDHEK